MGLGSAPPACPPARSLAARPAAGRCCEQLEERAGLGWAGLGRPAGGEVVPDLSERTR